MFAGIYLAQSFERNVEFCNWQWGHEVSTICCQDDQHHHQEETYNYSSGKWFGGPTATCQENTTVVKTPINGQSERRGWEMFSFNFLAMESRIWVVVFVSWPCDRTGSELDWFWNSMACLHRVYTSVVLTAICIYSRVTRFELDIWCKATTYYTRMRITLHPSSQISNIAVALYTEVTIG